MNNEELKDLEMPALLDLYLAEIKEMALLKEELQIANERSRQATGQYYDVEVRLSDAKYRVTNIDAEIHRRMGNPR